MSGGYSLTFITGVPMSRHFLELTKTLAEFFKIPK